MPEGAAPNRQWLEEAFRISDLAKCSLMAQSGHQEQNAIR
jgi:hypothetical protein